MNDLKMFHRTGAFGLAVVVLTWVQFAFWLIGPAPSVYEGEAFGHHLFTIKNIAFTRILLDQGIYVAMIMFVAGFRGSTPPPALLRVF